MGGPNEAGPRAPDTTSFYDDLALNPDYATDGKAGELSPVWGYSERLRTIIDAKGNPAGQDRQELANAFPRQLSTLGLVRQIQRLFGKGAIDAARPEPPKSLALYALLFPGEGKHNTGIKDLNDKILGQARNNQFIAARQQALATIFWNSESDLGAKFLMVGADYKTAQILAIDKSREDFAEGLTKLDVALVAALLPLLDEAEKEAAQAGDDKRVKAIGEVRTAVKKKGYRFDFLYGMRAAEVPKAALDSPKVLEFAFLMLTEALKGAGIARILGKMKTAHKKKTQKLVRIKPDPDKYDARGKGYVHKDFANGARFSGDTKEGIVSGKVGTTQYDFNTIFVNGVWTHAFYRSRRREYSPNPDVVRDVRKKALVKPPGKNGYKVAFGAQVFKLELWLVTINIVDFVKDFLRYEFESKLLSYHIDCYHALDEVMMETATNAVDWPRLERLLTRDLRNTGYAFPVLGSASEFQFFSYSSDYRARIFFSMDVRDLGIDLAFLYDYAMGRLELGAEKDRALMDATFALSDVVNAFRRAIFESVRDTFKTFYGKIDKAAAIKAAKADFGDSDVEEALPGFDDAVQLLMGGDEIFAAVHPQFAPHVAAIVAALDAATWRGRPLNMRCGVAYSLAKRGTDQKRRAQEAHDAAFRQSAAAAGTLKYWERAHRRIERLIDMLERNEKKKKWAPDLRKRLEALRLMKLFAAAQKGDTHLITGPELIERLERWSTDKMWSKPKKGDPVLIDFEGKTVDAKALKAEVEKLEKDVSDKVGKDNVHVDPPPLIEEPGWVSSWYDRIEDWHKEMEKVEKEQRDARRDF